MTECIVCQCPCLDRGLDYDSACTNCAIEVHTLASSDFSLLDLSRGDAFPKNSIWSTYIDALVDAKRLINSIKNGPAVDKPCKLCNIKNDLGAVKCYYCETPNPTDY
jgi:hypothetical protein